MKIYILLSGIFIGVLTRQASAICQCPEDDVACFQACVNKTNTCITSCGTNTVCYNRCIQDSWPGQSLTIVSNNLPTSTISQNKPTSIVKTDSMITAAPTLTSIPLASSATASSGGATAVSKTPISNSDRHIPTYPEFSPKPPTSSTAPPAISSGGSKSLLVPGVAIGVAMVTVIIQLFFLARMGTALFRS